MRCAVLLLFALLVVPGCGGSESPNPQIQKYPVAWAFPPAPGGKEETGERRVLLSNSHGWLVASLVSWPGEPCREKRLAWQIVLAPIEYGLIPKVGLDRAGTEITVQYGRYFIRDSPTSLRILREPKGRNSINWDSIGAWPHSELVAVSGQLSVFAEDAGRCLYTKPQFSRCRVDAWVFLTMSGDSVSRSGDGQVDGTSSLVTFAGYTCRDDSELLVLEKPNPTPEPQLANQTPLSLPAASTP